MNVMSFRDVHLILHLQLVSTEHRLGIMSPFLCVYSFPVVFFNEHFASIPLRFSVFSLTRYLFCTVMNKRSIF